VTRTRVLVADSLSIFRAGVTNVLARAGDFDVLEAGSTDEVIRVAADERPQLALVDLDLPADGGIATVERLVEREDVWPILWSFQPTGDVVLEGICAGAFGFLEKDVPTTALVDALRGAASGRPPLAPRLGSLLIEALHGFDRRRQARERLRSLSSRELQVLELVSRGAPNRQIAAELTISEFTVKRHVQNILDKLGVGSRRTAADCFEAAFLPGSALSAYARPA
jgi:DNA-binding NarL/FixJ family response regulator